MLKTEIGSLPKGWEACCFGDIASIQNGYAFKSELFNKSKERENDIPLIRQSQMKGAKIDISEAVFLPSEYLNKHPDFVIKKGDVIIGMSGSIGKVCLYSEEIPALQNQRTGKIVPHLISELDPKFFGLFLSNIERELTKYAKGMGVQNISSKDIEQLPFNLPPKNEQHRIVAKIEELFSELDKGIENLKTARAQLKVYRQALLKHAFEGKLTSVASDATWVQKTLGNLLDFLTSGSRGWKQYYAAAGDLFIRAQNIKHDLLELDDIAFVSLPERAEGLRAQVKQGDLLITITGANVTKSALVERDVGTAYVSQHVALCRPTTEVFPRFLYWFIVAEAAGRKQLSNMAYGAGKPGLNLENIRTVRVPLPGLQEQQRIVNLIEGKLSEVDQLELTISTSLQQAEALRQSILKRAFSGQLVPQDPHDEPASALLVRIKAEKAVNNKGETIQRRTKKVSA